MLGNHAHKRLGWKLLVAAGLMAGAGVAFAAVDASLELELAVQRTLADHPGLKSLGYQVEAQRGLVSQVRVAPAPEVGLMVENVLGSGDFEDLGAAETTLNLGWILERGKRQYYIDAARAGTSVLEAQSVIARLDAVAETARLFLDTVEAQEHFKLAEEATSTAEDMVTAIAERVRAGRTQPGDLARAEAQLVSTRLAAEDLEHELATARYQLSAQWGSLHPDFEQVLGDWETLPKPASFEALMAQVEQSPAMSVYLTEQRLQEANLRVAQAQAKPDWRFDASVRRFELTDDHAFVASITIPVTSAERNRGRLQQARARIAQADAERAASKLRIETQLFSMYQALQHSLHRASTLRREVLPRIEQAVTETRRGYEAGRYSYYELQQLRNELLTYRFSLLESSINARRHIVEIERLTGAMMPGNRPTP